jgi:hypothetical protein
MKRWEIVDILREILRVCGDKIKVEMVWLKGETVHAGIDDGKYQIVMSAIFDEAALACIRPLNEKYGLKMKQEHGLWVFTKGTNGSERVISSASAV